MTSGPTRASTEKFFKDNKYFGLSAENVIIFEQGVLPCISNEGKILMENKGKVGRSAAETGKLADYLYRLLLPQMGMAGYTKH